MSVQQQQQQQQHQTQKQQQQQKQQQKQVNIAKAEEAIANNKKKKEFEVCTCASTEVTTANSGCLNCQNCKQQKQQQQQQQQQSEQRDLNKFGNNSKLHFDEEDEAIDSGFLSGPNLASNLQVFDDNLEQQQQEEQEKSDNNNKDNLKKGQEAANSTYLDSGCIEAEADFEYDTENKINVAEVNACTTADEMRLKHNVDSGITERFCSLSLQTGGSTINNLNSTQRRSNSAPLHPERKSQQQQQTLNNRLNDWEQFYQQNSEGDTPLHLSCLAGAEEVVMALLRIAVHPCLYNIQNDDAQTPLHLATLSAQPKLIRWLLTMGADPSVRDSHGNTALHLAVISGEEQCVRALLTTLNPVEVQEAQRIFAQKIKDKKLLSNIKPFPVDLEIRNYNGERCVHLAAQESRINILRMLVTCGADINAREGKSGRTPLHIAILNRDEALVNFLLEECRNKLNLETATYAGLTAYQIARLLDKGQFSNILEQRGAEPLTPPESEYENSDGEDIEDTKVSLKV